jgi:hypothetical protein
MGMMGDQPVPLLECAPFAKPLPEGQAPAKPPLQPKDTI